MENVIEIAGLFIEKSWDMLVSIKYPGTNLPIAVIMLGGAVAVLGIRLVGTIAGMQFNFGLKEKGGNNGNIKISKNRQDDNVTY